MSLYNKLFGMNPLSDMLLDMLDFKRSDVSHFRDCYLAAGSGFPIRPGTNLWLLKAAEIWGNKTINPFPNLKRNYPLYTGKNNIPN